MIYKERNAKAIETLDSNFQPRVNAALADAEAEKLNILITSGSRSWTDQRALYNKYLKGGPKALPAGFSLHNYGVAFDCVPAKEDGSIDYGDTETYEAFAKICKRYGMEWGGDWKGKNHDKPHFQYTQGLTIKDFQAGKRIKPVSSGFGSVGNWSPEAQLKRLTRAIKRSTGNTLEMLKRQLIRLLDRIQD